MSLLSALIDKKGKLKSVETTVTDVLGCKQIEKPDKTGMRIVSKVLERGQGFVVDDEPDLQVAKILDYLFLGSQDPAQDVILLAKYAITHVLSVGIVISPLKNNPKMRYKKVDLLDVPEAPLRDVLKECFQFIDCARKESPQNKIFVHCNAGYSRSPTVVIAYLMKAHGCSLKEAFDMVNKVRKINPNQGFMKQLKLLESELIITASRPCSSSHQ